MSCSFAKENLVAITTLGEVILMGNRLIIKILFQIRKNRGIEFFFNNPAQKNDKTDTNNPEHNYRRFNNRSNGSL